MRPIELTLSGLHSYRDAVHVDFEHLGEHGVFGIFGSIGSGKSSLLDGLTLALYGIVDRVSGRSRQGIVNHHSKKVEVKLRFSISPGGEACVYEVHRIYRRSAQGGAERVNSRLSRVEGETLEVMADKEREVNELIESLLGLSATDFMRAVVLPQGRFMRFLHLKGADRRSMLQRIFRLSAYGEGLRKQIRARREWLGLALEGRRGQLSGLGDASAVAIVEAQIEVERADDMVSETEDAFLAMDEAWQAARVVRDRQQRLARAQTALAVHLAQRAEVDRRAAALNGAERAAALEGPWRRWIEATEAAEQAEDQARRSAAARADAIAAHTTSAAALAKVRADHLASAPGLTERRHELKSAVEVETQLTALQADHTALANALAAAVRASDEAEAALTGLEAQAAELAAARNSLASRLAECQVPREQRDALQAVVRAYDRIQQLTERRTAVEGRLATVRSQVDLARTEEARAQEAHRAATVGRLALEAQLAAAPAPQAVDWQPAQAAVRLWESAHREWERTAAVAKAAAAERDEAECWSSEAALAVDSSREECARIEAQLLAAEAAWVGLQRQHSAAVLAGELREGEPCAVCGSEQHPAPASAVQLDSVPMMVLQAAVERARAWRDGTAERAAAAVERRQERTRTLEDADGASALAQVRLRAAEQSARAHLPEALAVAAGGPEAIAAALQVAREQHEAQVAQARHARESLREAVATARLDEERAAAPVAAAQARGSAGRQVQTNTEAEFAALRDEEGAAWLAFEDVRGTTTLFDVKRLQAQQADRDRESQLLSPQIRDLEQRAEGLSADLSAAGAAAAGGAVERSRLEDQARTSTERIADLRQRLVAVVPDGSAVVALTAAVERLHALDEALAAATEARELARTRVEHAEKAATDAAGEAKAAVGQRASAQAELDRTRARLELSPDADVAALLLGAVSAATRADERAWLDAWERQRIAHSSLVASTEAELAGEGIDVRAFETLDARRQKAQIHLDLARTASLRAHHHHDDLVARAERYATLSSEVASLERNLARVDQLSRLVRGDKFVDFLANDHLGELVREANRYLGRLTDGRYTLAIDSEASFEIRDADGGGASRPVHTLSGGETFVASLALALALSTQVQSRSAHPLEFFFLDEGFGSLDAESLDRVMGAIESLRDDARTIGLISHVPQVRERVPRYIEVSGPGRDGSTGSTVAVRDN